MNKITFCIPSKNNLRYLKSSISSIIKNSSLDHEILVWVDASEDGTIEWLIENQIKHLINPNSEPQGIAAGYNRCIEAASNDIVCMFHADMFMGKNFDLNLLKHLTKNKVVSGTRIEPPLHPEGKEKIVKDFGMYPEDFNEEQFNKFVDQIQNQQKDLTTRGIFAPWVCYKEDIINIGLHDEYFHSYHEDSDIFNRFILNGMEIIQSRDALVYHLTCRGGKWIDGIEQVTQDPKFHSMANKAHRHYLRKWGSWIKNDEYQYPIILPKYNIAYMIENCSLELLSALEPWCDRIYTDEVYKVGRIWDYIEQEQNNTLFDLSKRVLVTQHNDAISENDIIVKFNTSNLTQQSLNLLPQLPEIIKDNGSVGEFSLDKFTIIINSLEEYQNDLIYLN
jgi:glycosyltransferase involved in cell wall biosynthesis